MQKLSQVSGFGCIPTLRNACHCRSTSWFEYLYLYLPKYRIYIVNIYIMNCISAIFSVSEESRNQSKLNRVINVALLNLLHTTIATPNTNSTNLLCNSQNISRYLSILTTRNIFLTLILRQNRTDKGHLLDVFTRLDMSYKRCYKNIRIQITDIY